jgi:hypothetical protein
MAHQGCPSAAAQGIDQLSQSEHPARVIRRRGRGGAALRCEQSGERPTVEIAEGPPHLLVLVADAPVSVDHGRRHADVLERRVDPELFIRQRPVRSRYDVE